MFIYIVVNVVNSISVDVGFIAFWVVNKWLIFGLTG